MSQFVPGFMRIGFASVHIFKCLGFANREKRPINFGTGTVVVVAQPYYKHELGILRVLMILRPLCSVAGVVVHCCGSGT